MKHNYKCLVLDHDDTVVNSTATIHYPCFVDYLKEYKPHLSDTYTLSDFFRYNFDPGVLEFFKDIVGLSDSEMEEEEQYWVDYVKHHIPTAYKNMGKIISEFQRRGGIVAVDSHSFSCYIERDYAHNSLPPADVIFGWELPREQRKPSPWTLFELMRRYQLEPHEILVVDDLKPGYDMARAAGCHFAAAGWAYDVPEIEAFMRKSCDYYLKTPDELYSLLFL